ncbi:class I SAM-dependent DNA methyltransferase [Crocinitomix catalasitica]|uniref:class I SAM-dependent DNA methyltransferase n=1 Tax=Crocinitomix catalasitica TaxID=184607 RepID=UPI0006888EFF|nr:class I SAM-dependent methyltransferase [Crocinitomix catalasitica]
MQEWFESWFDTHYYHILYKNRDHEEAELFIRNLFNYLNLSEDKSVLDLACGKGRHSILVNSLGFKTTGVDLSEESILTAKESSNDRLDFFVHDMRLPMQNRSFDLVLNLFTSFGYFNNDSENLQVFDSISSYLNADGLLVIDFFNAIKVKKDMLAVEVKEIEGIKFEIKKSEQNGFIIKDINFNDKGRDFTFQEQVQALELEDFERLLTKANFRIKETFGNYQLDNFDKDAERLIIIAEKL